MTSVLLAGLSVALLPRWAEAARGRDEQHAPSGWFGYMSDWLLHPRWSLWLDGHYNARAFGVLRVGMTHAFAAGPSPQHEHAVIFWVTHTVRLGRMRRPLPPESSNP